MIPVRLLTSIVEKMTDQVIAKLRDAREQRREIERSRIYCRHCDREAKSAVKFCPGCGKDEFLTGAERDDIAANVREMELAQKARKAEARDEVKRKEQFLKQAQGRCREILSMRYCGKCHEAHPKTTAFCTACGKPTTALSEVDAIQLARSEMPTLLPDDSAFRKLMRGTLTY